MSPFQLVRFALVFCAAGAGVDRLPAAGLAVKPDICNRACWGARAPAGGISTISSLTRAIVHHTAIQSDFNTTDFETSKANVRAVQNYHIDVNGWSDVGYHFLVDKLGNIFEGRAGALTGLPRGAHDGTNANSFGFNVMGYYHTPHNQVPTAVSMNALASLIAWRMPSSWAGPYGYPTCTYGPLGNCVGYVDSHRRVKATACPGDNIHTPYIGNNPAVGSLRDMIRARMNGPVCAQVIPSAPESLTAVAVSPTRVDLSWTDNISDEDGFKIYRSPSSAGAYVEIGTATANATLFSDTSVQPETTYYYIVTAHNCGGESEASNEVSVQTGQVIGAVQNPTQNLRVTTDGTGWQVLAYYYETGQSQVSSYMEAAGMASYDLQTGAWVGLFLYDYASAGFTQAVYGVNLTL